MGSKFPRILITGTTSGLGREFSSYYRELGCEVLSVNRREIPDPNNTVLDISNTDQVFGFLKLLQDTGRVPELFLLNAGINVVDNLEKLDLEKFEHVLKINLFGVLSFISALDKLKIQGKTIAVISSTSNIVPNPAHLGYFSSKQILHEIFKLKAKKDKDNHYKSVILSPVATNIMSDYPPPTGLQGMIFRMLVVSPRQAVPVLSRFFESEASVFYYTKTACAFYFAVKQVLKLFPNLYAGTKSTETTSLKRWHEV